MTAHVFNAKLDPEFPATLSHKIITGILREKLGFDGVITSDDMEMKAIAHHYGLEKSVPAAIAAGLDVLCFGNNLTYDPAIARKAVDILVRAVESGRLHRGPHRCFLPTRPRPETPSRPARLARHSSSMKQPRRPFPSLSALVALSALLLFAGCRTYPANPPRAKATRSSSPASSSTPARPSSRGWTPAATTPTASSAALAPSARAATKNRRRRERHHDAQPLQRPHQQTHPEEIEKIRGGGWTLPQLQNVVDQFVLHYDVCGLSKTCFNVLHDHRGLSIHFMLDLDGTIYQTLDLKERARHATISNDRSIGIEIANMGAYPPGTTKVLDEWYGRDPKGQTVITIPARVGDPHAAGERLRRSPRRPEPVRGIVQGTDLVQYDFTPEQYAALAKLTAALTTIFPKIKPDIPRGPDGKVLPHKLPDAELAAYQGVLGHYHIQTNKTDPGPALQWEKLMAEARALRRSVIFART